MVCLVNATTTYSAVSINYLLVTSPPAAVHSSRSGQNRLSGRTCLPGLPCLAGSSVAGTGRDKMMRGSGSLLMALRAGASLALEEFSWIQCLRDRPGRVLLENRQADRAGQNRVSCPSNHTPHFCPVQEKEQTAERVEGKGRKRT